MTLERWQRIKALFERAIDQTPAAYGALLAESGESPSIVAEVRRLIDLDANAGDFLDDAETVESSAGRLAPGALVNGQFRIESVLGHGGMGIVYRAEDLMLSRPVALKFVSIGPSGTPRGRERLKREARAAAALNHPNICVVYETGDHQGRPFIVMELLEGQTLKHRIGAGPLDNVELFNWALQVLSGLEGAHHVGIAHRDIKPANIFLTTKGQAKILDFGLAKLVRLSATTQNGDALSADSDLTTPGVAIGTVPYMSPEQARGEELDTRTDLFSFGTLLYEMATGKQPFSGGTAARIHEAILSRTPPPPSTLNARLPGDLHRIIGKALEKDPHLRYQKAEELSADLKRLADGKPPASEIGGGRSSRRVLAWASASAILLAALAVWGWKSIHNTVPRPLLPIMVAPFDNRTGDSSFDLTLANALSIDMEQSPYFKVLSRADVRRTLGLMERSPDEKLTDKLAREVCQRTNSRILISGSIDKLGGLYPLTIEATECTSGSSVASERAEPSGKEDVLKAMDRLTGDLRRHLGESAASVQRFSVRLLPVETSSFDAVRDYSVAIDLYDRGRTDDAVAPLKHAVELDPNFALAYSQLATMYDDMNERKLAVENIKRAYALRDSVGDRSRFPLMAAYYSIATGDLNEAMRSAQVWSETFSQDVEPWNRLANIQEDLGEYPQALGSAKKAAEIAPFNSAALTTLARAYYHVGQFKESKDVCKKAIDRGIDSPGIHVTLLHLAYLEGDRKGVHKQLEWSRTGLPERVLLMQSAALSFRAGRMREANADIDQSTVEGKKRGLGGFEALYALEAYLMAMTGEQDQALNLLAQKKVATELSNGLVASALVGDAELAESTVLDMLREQPANTLLNYVYAPQVRAAEALRKNKPKDAIEALQPALPYSQRDFHTPSLLGAAYLAAGMPAEAAHVYQQILDNPGIDPLSLLYPLARLGHARALLRSGRREEGRREYEQFFQDWNSADNDLPELPESAC